MAAEVKTFWGALLSVLLKCIAALGFTTPARTKAPVADRTEVTAVTTAAVAADAVGTTARAGISARAGATGAAPAPAGPPALPRTRRADVYIPAPRGCEPLPYRRERDRTLPPTMKQRIRAEAHGSSPSARSLPAGAEWTAGSADEPVLCG